MPHHHDSNYSIMYRNLWHNYYAQEEIITNEREKEILKVTIILVLTLPAGALFFSNNASR